MSNALALISPLTGNLDAGSNDITALDELAFADAAANPTGAGRLRRNVGRMVWAYEDTRTATVVEAFAIQATTSGTPAAGIGTGLVFRAESGDENPSDFGRVDAVATDVTAASEDTVFDFLLRVAGAALTAVWRFASTAAFRGIFTHANTADRTYTFPDASTTMVGTDTTQTLTNKTFTSPTLTVLDNAFTLQDNADTTKQAAFQLSGITTGQTRTLTVPDASTTMVGTDTTQTLSGKTLTAPVINNATTGSTVTIGAGSGAATMVGVAATAFADVGLTGTAEEILATYTIPANSLSANGKAIRIRAWINLGANANAKSFRIRLGGLAGDLVAAWTATTLGGGFSAYLEGTIIRDGASSQRHGGAVAVTQVGSGNTGGGIAFINGASTKTDTAAIALVVTGTGAGGAGDMTFKGMIVEFLN